MIACNITATRDGHSTPSGVFFCACKIHGFGWIMGKKKPAFMGRAGGIDDTT